MASTMDMFYEEYVRVSGTEHPELKQRLLKPNVEPVLKAMDEYLKASALYNHASDEFDNLPFAETSEEDWTAEEAKVGGSYAKNCDYLFFRVLASSRELKRVISSA
jgi:hypothetical protein